jgi:opacity protein-like surface antigen
MKQALIVLAAVFTLFVSADLYAGGFGLNVDYNKFNNADNGDWGIGARGEFGGSLALIASFDYYFVNDDIGDTKFYELNANLAYTVPSGGVRPYFGAGAGIARVSFDDNFFNDSDTELGFNLLGGLKFGYGGVNPFAEFRYVIYSGDETFENRWVISGGILF